MYVTLSEVMNMSAFKDAQLIIKTIDIQDKIVEWVSVIESPVDDFVRKNELVLSTGISCYQDEELFYQFVQEIIDSKASALVIATGKYIDTVPEEIILLAERNSFPIITLPWETRFSDVIQNIVEVLTNKKNERLQESEDIQQKLLNIILKGGGFTDIANFVFHYLNRPVMIADKRGHIKAKSKNTHSLETAWNNYLYTEDYSISLVPFESNHFATPSSMRYISIENHTVLQMMIQSASENQGYLLISVEKDSIRFLEERNVTQLLEHSATAIALSFLRENTIRETEMRLRDDFVWSLAKGTIKSWDYILSRSKSLNVNVNLPYICIVGFPENLQSIYKAYNQEKNSFDNWYQGIIRRIEDEIYYTGRTIHAETMSTFQKEHFIIFLEASEGNITNNVKYYIDQLQHQLNQLFPNVMISWGIGKTAGIKSFHISFQEAQSALEMGRRQKGPGHQNTYSDTRFDRALLNLLKDEELRKITDSTIGRLLKYNKERGINLIKTYKTYSSNSGNVSLTARQLNLHRQSLLYRLRKIETLTDCKLDQPDDVLLLDLSMKLWTLGILDE